MNKYLLIVLLSAVTIMAGLPAFALNTNPNPWAWVVSNYGDDSSLEIEDVGFDTAPWVYLSLPTSDDAASITLWLTAPGDLWASYKVGGAASTDTARWVSLETLQSGNNSYTWSSIAEAGEWEILAEYWYTEGGERTSQSTTFTVTPEPIGCTLFALGGLCLAALRRRRGLK